MNKLRKETEFFQLRLRNGIRPQYETGMQYVRKKTMEEAQKQLEFATSKERRKPYNKDELVICIIEEYTYFDEHGNFIKKETLEYLAE